MPDIDKLSADRLEDARVAFNLAHGINDEPSANALFYDLDEYDSMPEEIHCWVCDALKSSWDSACACDRGYHYGPDE